jgi:hypothetical protein
LKYIIIKKKEGGEKMEVERVELIWERGERALVELGFEEMEFGVHMTDGRYAAYSIEEFLEETNVRDGKEWRSLTETEKAFVREAIGQV